MKNILLYLLILGLPAASRTAASPFQKDSIVDSSIKQLHELITKNPGTVWGDSAESAVTYGLADNYRFITINQKEYLASYNWRLNSHIIVAQQTRRILDDRREGELQQLNAECYMIGTDRKVIKIWKLQEEAGQGFLHNFYETVHKGCCSLQDNHKLFSIASGKLVLEHTSQLLHAGIKNSENERFIGYKSASTYNTAAYEEDKLYIGTITYASADSALSRIIIRSKSKQEKNSCFGMGYGEISFDCSRNKDNAVNIVFFGGYTVTIPVKNDSLIIEPCESDHLVV